MSPRSLKMFYVGRANCLSLICWSFVLFLHLGREAQQKHFSTFCFPMFTSLLV